MFLHGLPYNDESEYLTDAFARESVEFIEQNRKSEKPFFLFFSFNAVHLPLEATQRYESRFPDIKDKKRKTYAGMLSALDDAIGRVMTKVRELDQEENSLVFFYSDNGGPTTQTTSRNDPLRGYKGQMLEGGIRVPFAMQWLGRIPTGKTYREPIMGFDVNVTSLVAAGAQLPTEEPLDGKDLIPFLNGNQTGRPHQNLFWRTGTQHAARVGDWKLVKMRDQPEMLFNLANDIGEKRNLSKRNPEKLKEARAIYTAWSEQMETPRWIRQDRTNAEIGGALKSKPIANAQNTIRSAFTKADRNGDGMLSPNEIWPNVDFEMVDANSDGFATIEEVRAHARSSQK
jgi:arylsulfatase A-like enzyme